MSVQALFELSSTWLNPKDVGLSPFLAPRETRLDTSLPRLGSTLYEYSMCTKRALNTRIIGFCEPTLKQCVDQLALHMRAGRIGGADEQALAEVLRDRRKEVDPELLPWKPREEYKAWLHAQGRLKENLSQREGRMQ